MPKGKGTYGKQVGRPKKKVTPSNSILNIDCVDSSSGNLTDCMSPECVGADCGTDATGTK